MSHSKIVEFHFPEVKTVVRVPIRSEYGSDAKPIEITSAFISKFKAPETLETDANALGYTFLDTKPTRSSKTRITDYKVLQLPWGTVYTWSTPTKGSSSFSYACLNRENFCFKVGPFTMIELGWSKASLESSGQQSMSNSSSLLNFNEKQLIQKLGKPDTKIVFEMKEASSEFRIELQNTYPLTDQKNLKVQIREWTWKKGDARTTVWLHYIAGTWTVLHVKDWLKDMEF